MQSVKKNLPLTSPRLYNYGGDTSKNWYILYKDVRGKRHKIQKGINIYKTAKERRKAADLIIKTLLNRKKAIIQGRQRKYVLEYLELRRPSWAVKSYQTNASKVRVFLEWVGDNEINQATIHGFFRGYLMQRSGKTYNSYKVVLKQILTNALRIDPIVFDGIEKRKVNSNTAVFFNTTKRKFLSNHLKNNDVVLWLAVQFVYYCYIRPRSELRFLKVSDILFDENKLCVHGSISKNRKTRFVQLPTSFKQVLEQHVKGRAPMEYIFHKIDDPYHIIGNNTLGARHLNILRKFNFDTNIYKMYGWKNTGMIEAIKNGFSLKWIQVQAGHHSLEQTDQYLKKMGFFALDEDLTKFPSF